MNLTHHVYPVIPSNDALLDLLRDALGRAIASVVLALNCGDHLLHLLDLATPFIGGHLGLLFEQLFVRLPVAATQSVPQSGELTVVVVEIQVVHSVAGSTIDDGAVRHVLAVVDQDGPDLDEGEEQNVGELLQREDEREKVIRDALCIAVKRVESMRSIRSRHDPFVVRLVEALVDQRMVKTSVNPVDEEVGEHEEERELKPVVPSAEKVEHDVVEGRVRDSVVHEAVAANLGHEDGHGEDGHDGYGSKGLLDLESDLVLQILGMLESSLVEDEDITERCAEQVDGQSEKPARVVSMQVTRSSTRAPVEGC